MGISTAERNRRKRERKKRDRDESNKLESDFSQVTTIIPPDVEIEYVPEPLLVPDTENNEFENVRILQELSAAVITDDERRSDATTSYDKQKNNDENGFVGDDDDENNEVQISKRKLREILRPSIAQLKQAVKRPDLVEAHDVTAEDPEFLIFLKSIPGTVQVPRHWGRKRKFLQGKRGFEKPPFQLPDFIVKTGITDIRDTIASEEESMSIRQKNRMRVAPKMGAIDVDYRTLHDAFFKHQTKPISMTNFGDLYFEGKEMETKTTNIKPGKPLTRALRDALGMTGISIPVPWLINMQRYGPPPSWPNIPIPGLNSPLPNSECQYGYHPGGWGKPPIDDYGRPLYGGNPFDPPGSSFKNVLNEPTNLVTSDGKTVSKVEWGAMPMANMEETIDHESSEEEMDESSSDGDEDDGDLNENFDDGMESVLPAPIASVVAPSSLRKETAGDETPLSTGPPKQLYQIIEQKKTVADPSAVFASEVAYAVPTAASVPEGAESVLSKVLPANKSAKSSRKDDDDDDDLGKNFKF